MKDDDLTVLCHSNVALYDIDTLLMGVLECLQGVLCSLGSTASVSYDVWLVASFVVFRVLRLLLQMQSLRLTVEELWVSKEEQRTGRVEEE